MMQRTLLLTALCVLLGGCAAVSSRAPESSSRDAGECHALYADVDRAVDAAGVRDGAAARVAQFAQLRVNRLLASFAAEPMNAEQTRAWIMHMAALDLDARRVELANLPSPAHESLSRQHGDVSEALARCSVQLQADDLAVPARLQQLREAARVPDDYDSWKRVAGVYWLSRIPFASGVRRYQAQAQAVFDAPLEALPVAGRLIAYRASTAQATGSATPLARLPHDVLGVPQPDDTTLDALFDFHAPVWIVDEVDANDRIGRVVFDAAGDPTVDVSQPTLYRRLAHTRVGEWTLLQLVYSVWFPARPKSGALDLLGGELDGIVWRTTLAPDGAVLMHDTIHSCGCYHQFFPTPRAQLRMSPEGIEEGAFVPQRLDASAAPPALRVAARTHYLQRVLTAGAPYADARTLQLAADDDLRSLALPGGGRRSAFDTDGIVAHSARGERYLFWPMGVRNPGAMRQWGRHATAFVGRRHFDDARLLERYFDFELP